LALVEAALTYARVRFEFLLDIQAPCLPVRAGDRGLIYPRTGTSWCTGPELVGARDMGATIQVEAGWRIDWISDSVRPFGLFTRKINEIRADAKAVGDVIRDELAKEVGNSAYGKIAQAVEAFRTITDGGIYAQRGKRVFNTRTGELQTLTRRTRVSWMAQPVVGSLHHSVRLGGDRADHQRRQAARQDHAGAAERVGPFRTRLRLRQCLD